MPSKTVMHRWKHDQLHSGSKKGPIVKKRKQAIAIMLSEKRAEKRNGGKYPEKTKKSWSLVRKSDVLENAEKGGNALHKLDAHLSNVHGTKTLKQRSERFKSLRKSQCSFCYGKGMIKVIFKSGEIQERGIRLCPLCQN